MAFLSAIKSHLLAVLDKLTNRPNSLKSQLAAALAQNRELQESLQEALRASQELNRQSQLSIDRVIMSRFDAPIKQQVFEQPNNGSQFPSMSLSDILNMEESEFVQL